MPISPLYRHLYPAEGRLRVTPDDPADIVARPQGKSGQASRRPHTDAIVLRVRDLIQNTPLSYGEISERTGVGRASICRWTKDQNWQRHAFAPRATDTIPPVRAGRKLRLRMLAERLRALAERHVRELEESEKVDVDRLIAALTVLKMARLEAMGRRRRRRYFSEARTGEQTMATEAAVRQALVEMRRGGVERDRIPQDALDLLTQAYEADDDHPALRPRGWKRR